MRILRILKSLDILHHHYLHSFDQHVHVHIFKHNWMAVMLYFQLTLQMGLFVMLGYFPSSVIQCAATRTHSSLHFCELCCDIYSYQAYSKHEHT